jgi:hypothetical protein
MRIVDISSTAWIRISGERLPQTSLGRLGMEHLALFGQLDYSLRGQLSRRGRWPWERREVSGPQFDADTHVSAVGDVDVPHQSGSVVYGEDLETAPEERVGGVCDLDLFGRSFRLLVI